MSQTETHFGKLRKVEILENQTFEDWCQAKCMEKGIKKISNYNKNWIEEFKDLFNEKYFIVDGEIWHAFEHIESEGDVDVMIPNSDGTITFVQQFDNGGTCLSEIVEDSIKKLKKENKI